MDKMLNIMRREAERVAGRTAQVRIGVVTGYDPSNYAAKVTIQPEGYETGFLPIGTTWSGDSWGEFYGPTPGDVVYVHFQEGGKQAGFIGGCFYGDRFRPLPVPPGERWTVHKSGSFLKFHDDGSIEMGASTNLTLGAGSTLRLTAPTIQVHAAAEYRFDVNGHGQAWHANRVNTYQIGEVTGTTHAISPPEIGD